MIPRAESVVAPALFATVAQSLPVAALRCALSFSDLLGTELHVLRVLPVSTLHMLETAWDPTAGDELFAGFVHAVRSASAECSAALAERFVGERLYVQVGDFFAVAIAQAREMRAALLIVAGSEVRGSQVTSLVRNTGLSVLVVRAASVENVIVAATDLIDSQYPVLRRAAQIGRCSRTRVIAVHTAPETRRSRTPGLARLGARRRVRQQRLDALRSRLMDATQAVDPRADAVLALGSDPVAAILREARASNARLVVVGTGARSSLRRAIRQSVAARLIDRAHRSVLVTPLGQSGRAILAE